MFQVTHGAYSVTPLDSLAPRPCAVALVLRSVKRIKKNICTFIFARAVKIEKLRGIIVIRTHHVH